MKKIALFSLMCCLCVSGVGAATYNCEVQEISSLSWKYSNEFLFPTYGDYNDANGRAYVCGHRGIKGCDSGAMVLIAGEHYFRNDRQEDELYRCSTNGANAWAKSNKDVLPKCTSDQIKTFTLFGEMSVGKRRIYCKNAVGTYSAGGRCVGRNEGDICWTDYCDEDCDKRKPQPQPQPKKCKFENNEYDYGAGVKTGPCEWFKTYDASYADLLTGETCEAHCLLEKKSSEDVGFWSIKKCPDDMTGVPLDNPDAYKPRATGYKKCVCKDGKWNPANRECEKESTPVDPIKQKTCKEKRTTVEGLACCDLPEKEATYDEKTKKCNCKDGKEFKINEKTKVGQCVVKEVTQPAPVVEGECEYYIKAGIKCANGNYYLEEGQQKVKKSDFEGKTCDEITRILDNDVNRLINTFKELCKEKQPDIYVPQPQTGPSKDEIEQAQKVLSAFTASAKDEASVWKTAEGKFNTTRLASDITAGVVLGTVGGVVTGNIIKKNQVKKGFEALHCTVGGQKVADWGDEFSVGLQR